MSPLPCHHRLSAGFLYSEYTCKRSMVSQSYNNNKIIENKKVLPEPCALGLLPPSEVGQSLAALFPFCLHPSFCLGFTYHTCQSACTERVTAPSTCVSGATEMMLSTAPVVKCLSGVSPRCPLGLFLSLWSFLPVSIWDVGVLRFSPAILLLGYFLHATVPWLLIQASKCW